MERVFLIVLRRKRENAARANTPPFVGMSRPWTSGLDLEMHGTICDSSHNIPPIHMSRIIYPESKDDNWKKKYEEITRGGVAWEDWYASVLDDFAQLIVNSNIVCVGAGVDVKAYREIQKRDPEDFMITNIDSNVFLLQSALMFALDRIETVDRLGILNISIDDDQEHAFEYYKSFWNLKTIVNNPKLPSEMKPRFARISDRVDQIGFCGDAFHPGIQAADMIAYVSRVFKINENTGNSELMSKLYALLTRGGSQQPKMYSEEILWKLAGNTAKSIRMGKDEKNCPDGI